MDTTTAWNANAAFWDAHMGEGSEFYKMLLEPYLFGLLSDVPPPAHILDIGCGNGLISRKLHELGYQVTAFDGAHSMISIAKEKSSKMIDFYHIDATDEETLKNIAPQQSFDGALCNMVLMDIEVLSPLFKALRSLIKPKAPFIFSLCHPCFNRTRVRFYKEFREEEGDFIEEKGIKITKYSSWVPSSIQAVIGQPQKNLAFDRTLSDLLKDLFAAGFVLDRLIEPSFFHHTMSDSSRSDQSWSHEDIQQYSIQEEEKDLLEKQHQTKDISKNNSIKNEFSWKAFPEIPPALMMRAFWI